MTKAMPRNLDSGTELKRSKKTREMRDEAIQRYGRIHGGRILVSPGFYYGTVEAKLAVEHAGKDAIARVVTKHERPAALEMVIGSAFELAVGDVDLSRLGGMHVVNEADTNIHNAGQTLYCDELFLVEALSARVRGVYVQYDPEDIRLMKLPPAGDGGGVARSLLSGKIPLHDATEAGLVKFLEETGTPLAPEINRLHKRLPEIAKSSSLHFLWKNHGIGGSCTTTDATICAFSDVQGSMSAENERTPLDLMQGYLWVLDKQFQPTRDQGGNGIFDVELHLDEEVGFLFNPSPIFGIEPGKTKTRTEGVPVGFAVDWEIRLHGTSLLPEGAPRFRELMPRRKL